MLSGCKVHHGSKLGLNVTLPLNISLDLGSERGAQHDLAQIDTDSGGHML